MTEQVSEHERRRLRMVRRSRQLLIVGMIAVLVGCAVIAIVSDPFGRPLGMMIEFVGSALLTIATIGVLLMPTCLIAAILLHLLEWWMHANGLRFRLERWCLVMAYVVPMAYALTILLVASNAFLHARSPGWFLKTFAFPSWFFASYLLVYAGIVYWISSRMILLHDQGRCFVCGYDMSGLSKAERCPECGAGRKV